MCIDAFTSYSPIRLSVSAILRFDNSNLVVFNPTNRWPYSEVGEPVPWSRALYCSPHLL